MIEPVILASRKGYEPGSEVFFSGECIGCGENLDEPDMAGLHLDHGEFVAITQECGSCGLKHESFYDWDRTERRVRDE